MQFCLFMTVLLPQYMNAISQRWYCPAGSSVLGSAVLLISSAVAEQKILNWTEEKAKVCF